LHVTTATATAAKAVVELHVNTAAAAVVELHVTTSASASAASA
jgi:hypothetical protein